MGPYERLLGDAMRGDQALFAREDTVELAWEIVDPALDDQLPVHTYQPRTMGTTRGELDPPRRRTPGTTHRRPRRVNTPGFLLVLP